MNEKYFSKIAEELKILPRQVKATAELLEEGGTVPFIARYRKEATELLDEVAIASIRDRLVQLEELDKRRDSILKSMTEREILTDELEEKINAAETMTNLEDIYLPYRPKRRTRATIAREKGLEPLAKIIFEQNPATDPITEAAEYIDEEKGVEKEEDALAGCRDIIAEWVNEDQEARERMRALYEKKGVFKSTVISGKEEEGAKFRDYFEWEEPLSTVPSHRVLAMRRGEKEGYLTLWINPPEEDALALLEDMFVKGEVPASQQVKDAVTDCYKRLLSYSMETETRLKSKVNADKDAIKVFADNLRELLLASPLGQKTVMAIDPGIRTGCKVTCLDRQGKLLHSDTIYPYSSESARLAAGKTIKKLFVDYSVEAVAVGNGTAGRETVSFIKELSLSDKAQTIMVNESGASVYSASSVARNEFPDLDLSYRGAVSIGRRLMDPLAELVKIDPKSIGVGQYQHDVNQQFLKEGLDDIVISCVNGVGVEVNTASEQLLAYVSGLGPQLAKNIIAYRNENGPLKSRKELKKVPRLGPKAFEQAAGFLRIRDGENPLDGSAVHPESYGIVELMASDIECNIKDLLETKTLRDKIELQRYVSDSIGLPTLTDILEELDKPGRDPRKKFESFEFTDGIEKPQDLDPGMRLPGVVTNVTAFGAFVDIGVHQDGLVHVSQIADRFVKDPRNEVKVNQKVNVTVLEVDLKRNRISLSMKGNPELVEKQDKQTPKKTNIRKGNSKGNSQKNQKPEPFNNPFADVFK